MEMRCIVYCLMGAWNLKVERKIGYVVVFRSYVHGIGQQNLCGSGHCECAHLYVCSLSVGNDP